jgi:pimeloyl-ACP methyl ester carboxylesterase
MNKEMTVSVDDIHYDIYYIEKNLENGFNFPCILGLPNQGNISLEMIVECNNTYGTDTEQELKQKAIQGTGGRLAQTFKGQNAPILIPILPNQDGIPYFQQLSKESLDAIGEFQNIDIQLVNAINYAKEMIKATLGTEVNDQVFLNGYSSSGVFAQRFALLHPEIVHSVCVGGASGSIPIPLDEFNGIRLPYPIGISDYEQITGKPFNSEEYASTNFFYYVGSNETQNHGTWDINGDKITRGDQTPAPMHDMSYNGTSISQEAGQQQRQALGTDMWERYTKSLEIYKQLGYNIDHRVYSGYGHSDLNDIPFKDINDFYSQSIKQITQERS